MDCTATRYLRPDEPVDVGVERRWADAEVLGDGGEVEGVEAVAVDEFHRRLRDTTGAQRLSQHGTTLAKFEMY